MKTPECPDKRDDCAFQHLGATKTLMYSPLVFNREGEPIGGGANVVTEMITCLTCDKGWTCKRTQLQIAKNETPEWKEILS
jgi:hypothetical protein